MIYFSGCNEKPVKGDLITPSWTQMPSDLIYDISFKVSFYGVWIRYSYLSIVEDNQQHVLDSQALLRLRHNFSVLNWFFYLCVVFF